MSYIVPNSTIQILSDVPFDMNYENTMYFSSIENQNTYFTNKISIELTAQSYQRVDKGILRVGYTSEPSPYTPVIKNMYSANYMRFKNTNFENKWFYAFIERVEYVNNNTVEIYYKIDVIQTWMFDITFDDCLIEREHTATDVFGENTIPENLETGPLRSIPMDVYKDNGNDTYTRTGNKFKYTTCVVMATALDSQDIEADNVNGVLIPGYGGINAGGEYYTGVRYYTYPLVSNATAGVYQINFAGGFVVGDKILVQDVMVTLATQANVNNLANYVANTVNDNSSIYTATGSDYGVVTLIEKNGYYGFGPPNVETNSENGYFYQFTVTPGIAGGIYENIHRLNRALITIASHAKSDAIVGLFMMPYEFTLKNTTEISNGVSPIAIKINVPYKLDTIYNPSNGNYTSGYTPRNKKLLCYPYNSIYVTNNVGNSAEFRYENFSSPQTRTECFFKIWGNLSMNPGMYCAPMFYNGNTCDSGAIDEMITVSGFPMCSYSIDSYKAWLSQNAGSITAAGGSLMLNWLGGLANFAGFGSPLKAGDPANFVSPANETMSLMGQMYDHSRKPPQAEGSNNGNMAYQGGQLTFSFYRKQIKTEYARKIDKFFDMYGYKVNRIGTPLIDNRPCYTYTKTVGCHVSGNIPKSVEKEIENIFNRGIRFWKSTAVFGSYDPLINNNRPPV